MIVMSKAVDIAREKALISGVAIVGTNNVSSSTGAIGYYVEQLAKAGLIGFAFSGSPPMVSPHGSKTRLFGTNPIAFAVPSDEGPIALDMSTSAIAYFGVMEALLAGEKIPEGVALDVDGNVTTDPSAVMESGSIRPFDKSYKGSNLSLMVEMLTGPLVRSSFVGIGADDNDGNLVIAFDPTLLGGGLPGIKAKMSKIVDKLHKCTPITSGTKLYAPGERGNAQTKKVLDQGFIEVEEVFTKVYRKQQH
eukprot:TRINITY_DN399_c0_g1_i1.p1 TRINITY_DN399_c0_g1~~TRINITY_DN399_c0_g1_i1.p1  ORF type:complete len:249 (-),score=59.68 TRINITY_DN399_c0_g1_i1:40-786(-)